MLALLVVDLGVYPVDALLKGMGLDQSRTLHHPFGELTQKERLLDDVLGLKLGD